eukprot:754585-Hanusia_phi.AAC.3
MKENDFAKAKALYDKVRNCRGAGKQQVVMLACQTERLSRPQAEKPKKEPKPAAAEKEEPEKVQVLASTLTS